ncbi:MAG: DUF5916 domain-containing protein [Pseudomonadales bacterium]
MQPIRFLIAAGFLFSTLAHAAGKPQLTASRLDNPPVLDGDVLGDVAWQGLQSATGFTQTRPIADAAATQATTVFVGYDDEALYIGVVCHDDNPAAIVVGDARRDSNLDDVDSFQVILDAYHDRQNGLIFGTTPSSVEYDAQVTREGTQSVGTSSQTSSGFNLEWNTTWSVRSKLGDYGWSSEMRIPFKSLRYPSDTQPVWGINFQRNIRRNNEVAYWSPLPRQFTIYRVSEAGTLAGLKPPAQRNFKLMPYVLGQFSKGGRQPSGTHFDQEVGMDVKLSVTSGLTLDATWNTDFAQVEADELQVNLDRFSVFFPEKRPFFLENAGQFTVGTPQEVELFFSRRIGISDAGRAIPIVGGARLSGKIGDATNIGALRMRSEDLTGIAPQNDYTVLRVNQELPNRSSIGALYVERDGDGGVTGNPGRDYNRTYAIDGRLGLGDNHLFESYYAKTQTPGRNGDDTAWRLRYNYTDERWTNYLGWTKVGDDFNPEVGFLRRRNYNKYEALLFLRHRPQDWLGLYELRPHIGSFHFYDDTGYWESGFTHVDNHWEWKNGIEVHTGVNFTHEGVKNPFQINPGTFVVPGRYDHKEADLVFKTDEGRKLSASLETKIGGFFGGDRVNATTGVLYRPGERFSAELNWIYNDIDLPVANGNFEVNVARLRMSYSFTPKMQLQMLLQTDDRTDFVAVNLRFAWLQTANAGLYLVYNEIDDESLRSPLHKQRELVLKYSRIFDLF